MLQLFLSQRSDPEQHLYAARTAELLHGAISKTTERESSKGSDVCLQYASNHPLSQFHVHHFPKPQKDAHSRFHFCPPPLFFFFAAQTSNVEWSYQILLTITASLWVEAVVKLSQSHGKTQFKQVGRHVPVHSSWWCHRVPASTRFFQHFQSCLVRLLL